MTKATYLFYFFLWGTAGQEIQTKRQMASDNERFLLYKPNNAGIHIFANLSLSENISLASIFICQLALKGSHSASDAFYSESSLIELDSWIRMAASKHPAASYWQPWSTRDPFKERSTLPHTHLAQRHQRRGRTGHRRHTSPYHNDSQLDQDLSSSLRKRASIIITTAVNLMAVAKRLSDKTTQNKTSAIL